MLNSSKDFCQAINEVLITTTADETPTIGPRKQDAYINGASVVLKAFHCIKEFDLLPRFANLNSDDIGLAKQTFQKSLPQENLRISILQRLLMLPRVPEQQINLNECIDRAAKINSVYSQEVISGAAAMYKTLETLWPKLYPHQTPPPPSAKI